MKWTHHCLDFLLKPRQFLALTSSEIWVPLWVSGKRRGAEDVKEGELPSCLSNSNLKQSSLASTPRPFQPHLEAAATRGGPRTQAFPHTDGEKPVCPPAEQCKAPPPLPFPWDRKQAGAALLLRHRGAILAPIPWLPEAPLSPRTAARAFPKSIKSFTWPQLPQACQCGKDHHLYLPSLRAREKEVQRGNTTCSQW